MSHSQGPFLGKWWIAGNKEQSAGGRLDLADSFSLQTVEELKSRSGVEIEQLNQFIVEGQSLGSYITLYECFVRRGRYGEDVTQHEIFSPTVLVGPRHLDDPASSKFDRICFRLDNLNQFANRRSFDTQRNADDALMVTQNIVPNFVALAVGATITMGRTTVHNVGFNRVELTSTEGFYVELSEGLSLDDLMYKYIRPLQQLIALATAADCGVYDLQVADGAAFAVDHEYFDVHFWKSESEDVARQTVNPNMRFSLYSNMGRPTFRFEDLIPRWFEISAKYGPVLDLVFSLRTPTGYLESKIFAIASAVEAMHKKLFPGAGKRTSEEKLRIRQILESVPPEHCKWLEKALANADRPSYTQCVRELVDYAGDTMHAVIGNVDEWVRLVADARNGVAHARGIDADITATVNLMRSIQMLAELLLLRELGLTVQECAALADRDFEWRAVPPGLVRSFPGIF